jgi:NTE family protein
VFPIRPLTLALGVLGRRDHLVSNRALASWAGERLGIVRLEQADLPLHVVATALDSGEPVVLSNGPALTALLASCAIPGLLPPVERDGQLLIDGAVASDCPLPEARGLGATEAIVLPSFTRGAVDTRRRTAGALGLFAYEQVFAHWTADRSEAGMRVRVVPLPLRDGHGPLDFSRGAHRIEAAYAMTTRWLAGEEAGAAAA